MGVLTGAEAAVVRGLTKLKLLSEGTVFRLPLASGTSTTGLIARASRSSLSELAFCYFFAPRQDPEDLPTEKDDDPIGDLSPSQARLALRVDPGSLVSGDWPVVGVLRPFSRVMWPMPMFACGVPGLPNGNVVEYDENRPERSTSQRRLPLTDCARLPVDAIDSPEGAASLLLRSVDRSWTGLPISHGILAYAIFAGCDSGLLETVRGLFAEDEVSCSTADGFTCVSRLISHRQDSIDDFILQANRLAVGCGVVLKSAGIKLPWLPCC